MAPTWVWSCCDFLLIVIGIPCAQEPSCHTTNWFEYEFQVLRTLGSLEKETATLREKHAALIAQVEAI